jgi:molybdenum cofactor cytidylyltransferase
MAGGGRLDLRPTDSNAVIVGVVLAAGMSSRMGRPKQLLTIDGQPILRVVVDRALRSPLDEVVVVLGHRAEEIRSVLPVDPRVRSVSNPRFADGLSTSVAAGLGAAGPGAEAAVILLGDQPGLRPDAVAAVIEAFRRTGARAVQADYDGRPGHPTLLSRSVWAEVLTELAGDSGAADVLRRHPDWRAVAEVGGVPPEDVDTTEDYERVRRVRRGHLDGIR